RHGRRPPQAGRGPRCVGDVEEQAGAHPRREAGRLPRARRAGHGHVEVLTDVLLQKREGFVLVLTLNRPEARNALSPELIGGLSDALKAAADDDGVRAVIITGAGDKAFCAGMDLRAFSEARESGAGVGSFDALTWFHKGGFAKPVVAAVNGSAVAGGCELALAADLVVAADHAKFGLS